MRRLLALVCLTAACRSSSIRERWTHVDHPARVDSVALHVSIQHDAMINNWRKHREDRRPFARTWTLDPYSTAVMFGGWKGRGPILWLDTLPPNYVGLFAWLPRTWLLTAGWRRHGLLSMDEVPGPRPRASPRRGQRAPTPRPR